MKNLSIASLLLLLACSAPDAPSTARAPNPGPAPSPEQRAAREQLYGYLPTVTGEAPAEIQKLVESPASCPPDPGAPPGKGWAPGYFPCALTSQCVPGLICNYAADQADPTKLRFGAGCGLCESDVSACPPAAPWWGGCGGVGQPGCPPYISNGVQGNGCTWPLDCVSQDCDYGTPAPGWCGTCK